MPFLKRVLIALSLLLGVLFVYEGFDFEFRMLDYQVFDDYGIPIGIALIVFAALIARYWTIPE
jgi:hypothetical protein